MMITNIKHKIITNKQGSLRPSLPQDWDPWELSPVLAIASLIVSIWTHDQEVASLGYTFTLWLQKRVVYFEKEIARTHVQHTMYNYKDQLHVQKGHMYNTPCTILKRYKLWLASTLHKRNRSKHCSMQSRICQFWARVWIGIVQWMSSSDQVYVQFGSDFVKNWNLCRFTLGSLLVHFWFTFGPLLN